MSAMRAVERQQLIDCIGEELECLPLSPSVLNATRSRLAKTSLATLQDIWANRRDWKDAIARGLLV